MAILRYLWHLALVIGAFMGAALLGLAVANLVLRFLYWVLLP